MSTLKADCIDKIWFPLLLKHLLDTNGNAVLNTNPTEAPMIKWFDKTHFLINHDLIELCIPGFMKVATIFGLEVVDIVKGIHIIQLSF